jgi:flagellar hook-associated protein 2
VITSFNTSHLMLQSMTGGSNGALSITSEITATSAQLLSYVGSGGADATPLTVATISSGTLSGIPDLDNDALTGNLLIQVGSGNAHTITLGAGTTLSDGTPVNTLAALKQYINDNSATLGVTADIVQNSGVNTYSLKLLSNNAGRAGTLAITSNILDTSNQSQATLNYTNASDITSLTSLGVSMNNDGTIAFDATNLDSLLNTDFNSIVGMFQSVNSWGRSFATMLNNAGTTSSMGILKLALKSNSNIEKTLNDNVSKQEARIADQQKRLTAQLNLANQILQALPSQLSGMDMLYSAITGYNQK